MGALGKLDAHIFFQAFVTTLVPSPQSTAPEKPAMELVKAEWTHLVAKYGWNWSVLGGNGGGCDGRFLNSPNIACAEPHQFQSGETPLLQ